MQAPLFTAINPRFVETPNDYTGIAGWQAKLGRRFFVLDLQPSDKARQFSAISV
jgi:hypothetical protein